MNTNRLIDIVCKLLASNLCMGSGCGSVGRGAASDTRGPRIESSHRQTFISNICLLSTVNKEKEAENGPFKNISRL